MDTGQGTKKKRTRWHWLGGTVCQTGYQMCRRYDPRRGDTHSCTRYMTEWSYLQNVKEIHAFTSGMPLWAIFLPSLFFPTLSKFSPMSMNCFYTQKVYCENNNNNGTSPSHTGAIQGTYTGKGGWIIFLFISAIESPYIQENIKPA